MTIKSIMALIKYTKQMKHEKYLELDGEQFLKEYEQTPDKHKSFFEYLVSDQPTKPYGDYDMMVDDEPSAEDISAIHKENIKKLKINIQARHLLVLQIIGRGGLMAS